MQTAILPTNVHTANQMPLIAISRPAFAHQIHLTPQETQFFFQGEGLMWLMCSTNLVSDAEILAELEKHHRTVAKQWPFGPCFGAADTAAKPS